MKKIKNILLIGFLSIGLYSCTSNECVTCTQTGLDDIMYCSDGSIIDEDGLIEFLAQAAADGYMCDN